MTTSVSANIRRWAGNILLLAASLSLMLVILELALPFMKIKTIEEAVYQARRPVIQGLHGQFHPQLGYTLQKNLRGVKQYYPGQLDYNVDTNSQGFRGPEWDLLPHRKNVVLIGDSFGFGFGVEWDETLGRILEGELQKADASYQVINLAMPGWDIDAIVRGFEFYKDMLKPVAVVYVFCPNDLLGGMKKTGENEFDLAYHPGPGAEKMFEAMVARQQPGYRSWDKFRRKSYLKAYHARIIRPIFSKRIRASMHIDPAPQDFDFPPPISPPARSSFDPERKEFFLYCLDRLRAMTGKGRLYIIDTSDKSILYRQDVADNRRWVLHEYGLAHESVTFVDFETFARMTPDGRKFYLDYDDHWSVTGHAAAARLLWENW
ncbi:MAG: hypothetical protein GX155_09275 [Smithella sp.]|jgi:hypothetical protein|nr:hypothetical protein [Smithella sp.]